MSDGKLQAPEAMSTEADWHKIMAATARLFAELTALSGGEVK